jgi:hypothetical protein
MKAKLLAVYPAAQVVVQNYRGEGVLQYLRRADPDVEVIHPQGGEVWRDLIRADAVYFMRTTDPAHVNMARVAKTMGVPVWVDMDDNLFEIEPDNPAYGGYTEDVLGRLATMLDLADVVTVSTEDLAAQLQEKHPNTRFEVVPNALDTYAFRDLGTMPKAGPRHFITWRGGGSHIADLLWHTPAFHKFDQVEDPRWGVHFIGFNPSWLTDPPPWLPQQRTPRYFFTPYVPHFYTFVRQFRETLAPWAHVVPLKDSRFNRAKSAISAIEGIYAGAVPIVPAWREWEIPGAFTYSTTDGLAASMQAAAALTEIERRQRWERAVQWVKDARSMDAVNRLRLQVLASLL